MATTLLSPKALAPRPRRNRSRSHSASAASSGNTSQSGSTSYSSSKSKSTSNGHTSGDEESGTSGSNTTDIDARNSAGGSTWEKLSAILGDTPTKAVRTSSGNARGDLKGSASGNGNGTKSTSHTNANENGRAGGRGEELVVSLTKVGGVSDLITTFTTGNANGKSNGNANGTIESGPQGVDSSQNVGAHSESDETITTTRTKKHRDPNTSSLTVVTRTDAGKGNLNSNGTIDTGSGAEQGNEGTFSGSTDNKATVVVEHTMNGKIGDHTYTFGSVHSLLKGGENIGFDGDWDADEIHADLVKRASENTNGTEGTRTYYVDFDGVEHYSGETATQTIDAPDTSTVTDTVTITSWQYDIGGLDDFYIRDRIDTSILTSRSGKDEQGVPSQSESIVQSWNDVIVDYLYTFEDHNEDEPDPYWEESWTETTIDKSLTDDGSRTKTTTLGGPANRRKATLHTSYDSTVIDKQSTTTNAHSEDADNDPDAFYNYYSKTTDEEKHTVHNTYDSDHLVTPQGTAMAGHFTADSRDELVKSNNVELRGGHDYETPQYEEEVRIDNADDDSWTFETLSITEVGRENGTYYDRPKGDSFTRAQAGSFKVERTIDTTDDGDEARYWYIGFSPDGTTIAEYEEVDDNSNWSRGSTRTVINSGSYGPEGGQDKIERSFSESDYTYVDGFHIGDGDPGQHLINIRDYWVEFRADGTSEGYIDHTIESGENDHLHPRQKYKAEGDPLHVWEEWIYDDFGNLESHSTHDGDTVTTTRYITQKTGPAPPEGVAAAFFAGLGYGVIEVGNAGVKVVSLGFVNYDDTANYYGDAAGLSETDQRLTRLAANIGVNAAAAAAAPAALGALGKTGAGQAVSGVVGRAMSLPGASTVVRGVGIGRTAHNGVNAARNGIATAQAIADHRWLDALESATLTVENAAGAYGGAKALFAKPKGVSTPPEPNHCFVQDTTVKEPIEPALSAHLGTYVAIAMLTISVGEYVHLRRKAKRRKLQLEDIDAALEASNCWYTPVVDETFRLKDDPEDFEFAGERFDDAGYSRKEKIYAQA